MALLGRSNSLLYLFWRYTPEKLLHRRYLSVPREFRFDRIMESTSNTPEEVLQADAVSMVSLKSIALPTKTRRKIEGMLQSAGPKKDIERVGSFIARKLISRSSVEIPRVLPSALLNEQSYESSLHPDKHQLPRNIQARGYAPREGGINKNEAYNEAVAHAEDSRHKLYKVTYFPEAALSFVAHRFAGVFAACLRTMLEVRKRVPNFNPRKMMEYGAGAAPGILAASVVWKNGFIDALAIEPSINLSRIGQHLTVDLPYVRWQYNLYESTESFDLIVIAYSLMDIPNHQARMLLIRSLWNRMSANGILMIQEAGTPTGFRFIHGIRELFIKELDLSKFHFVAPCPHESVCALALTGRDWCHFSQKVEPVSKHVYRKSTRKEPSIDEEKFSFLVVKKGPGPRYLYKSEDDAPDYASKSFFWPRIVMPVIKAGEHVLIDVCSSPHSFERLAVTKSAPEAAGYRIARKALWGDLWRFKKRLSRPEARAYTPEEIKKQMKRFSERIKGHEFEEEADEAPDPQINAKVKEHFGC